MLGRTGDYLNSALMALASAERWFGQAGQLGASGLMATPTAADVTGPAAVRVLLLR